MQQMESEADFTDFLSFYLTNYAYESITFLNVRLSFNEFARKKYPADKAAAVIASVDWVAWVQTPGPIPPDSGIDFDTPASTAFTKLANDYIALEGFQSPPNIDLYLKETKNVNLKVVFNNQLLSRIDSMNSRIIQRVD